MKKINIKIWFNLNLRSGVNLSSLSIQNSYLEFLDTDFGNKLTFRFGVEAEFVLPFNKNKWAIIIEPTYQYFKSEKETSTSKVDVDYKSIEFPIGIRYYLYLNNNSKLFVNGSYVYDINSNKSTIRLDSETNVEINSRHNLAFGLGHKFKDKYSIELRYQTTRTILSNYIYWDSDYQTFSVILGYSIF